MDIKALDIHTPINEIVKTHPDLMPLLQTLEIDFCCGGHKTLAEACAEKKLDPKVILTELLGKTTNNPEEKDWSLVSMSELVDHLEATHHLYLRQAEPRLNSLLQKVIAAHGKNHPELKDLEHLVRDFWSDMTPHLMKEERILFAMIRQMDATLEDSSSCSVMGPIRVMRHEHEVVGRILEQMRSITNGYTPPADGCTTYSALMDELKSLETDTLIHIHKENNILFPKALEFAQSA